ncbi:kinetochore protein NDC80 homolog [Melanaphis sacchari]|uniref:kinetochore protein NDC80 homolog n=1 Tax=Melanaphis sacchari TaxID=742174 RepID=UPI000DC142B3|nr:kinetochore protein NDC80 homolog [Melanaphis sacchari]
MRLNSQENHNKVKKSILLKPGFLAKKKSLNPGLFERKKSISSENLSKHHSKQWLSKSKNPETTPVIINTSVNKNASTPNLNPNFPGMNSSDKSRNSNSEPHYSNYGVVKNRKEVRPLAEKDFQQTAIHKIQNYFLTAPNASKILNNGSIRPMTTTRFTDMCKYLLQKLERNQILNENKYVEDLPKIMKKYYYKGKVDKSWLITVNASHSFPQVVGLFLWLVELCESQKGFNVLDEMYPLILDSDKSEDYEQKVQFKLYLPFLLNVYQIESKGTVKLEIQESLHKQEELLLENYIKTLGIDKKLLIKLETEVNNHKKDLNTLSDITEEKKLEEMKAMKIALHKDIVNSKNYIKDLQTCYNEIQEYILKKKDECVFQENNIENLQKELNMVNSCINSQEITQADKKIIEEDIFCLKQDLKFEENCLEEYKNIVCSENLKVIDVKLKLDTLFVQYHKLCAENIVVLPELENAITDKNILAIYTRESLKKVDELLKSLKNKNVQRLKEVEQKNASIQINVDLAQLEYNKLKLIVEKSDFERNADKKHWLEIADRQFKEKEELENKLNKIKAEIENNNFNDTENLKLVEIKTEEKNNLHKQINEMENEKEYISRRIYNSLKKHAELIKETKKFIKKLNDEELQKLQSIKSKYIQL